MLDLQTALYFVTLVFAFLSAILGILAVNTLFKDKLRELFSDGKFFIFFFLIVGYVLFALGELSWYLIYRVFEKVPETGMPDFYWVTGAFFMLLSFVALSYMLYKNYGQTQRLVPILAGGSIFVVLVIAYVSIVGNETVESTFLTYFYPLMTSLILISSTHLFLFFKHLDSIEANLIYLFFANIAFLGGDLLYAYWGLSGFLGSLANLFYVLAYALSAFAFFALLVKFYHHASGKSLLR